MQLFNKHVSTSTRGVIWIKREWVYPVFIYIILAWIISQMFLWFKLCFHSSFSEVGYMHIFMWFLPRSNFLIKICQPLNKLWSMRDFGALTLRWEIFIKSLLSRSMRSMRREEIFSGPEVMVDSKETPSSRHNSIAAHVNLKRIKQNAQDLHRFKTDRVPALRRRSS